MKIDIILICIVFAFAWAAWKMNVGISRYRNFPKLFADELFILRVARAIFALAALASFTFWVLR